MHPSALFFGGLFFKTYVTSNNLLIVDVGSYDVNGTLKPVIPPNNYYIGVDMEAGKNVDVVIKDIYKLPFDDNSVDIVVSTSCFEHCEFFWLEFLEIIRILKPTGLFYMNAPSNGPYHRHPFDYWRFYPDSGLSLQNWARRNGYNTILLESFIGTQFKNNTHEKWNDFVAVFLKDMRYINLYPKKMQSNANFTNGIIHNSKNINNFSPIPEDQLRCL